AEVDRGPGRRRTDGAQQLPLRDPHLHDAVQWLRPGVVRRSAAAAAVPDRAGDLVRSAGLQPRVAARVSPWARRVAVAIADLRPAPAAAAGDTGDRRAARGVTTPAAR